MIGIITFHRSHNCGSILQAYALQTVLKQKYGMDNEIIDFSNEGQRRYYATLVSVRKPKDILKNIVFGLFFVPIDRHRREYDAYIHKIFKLSSGFYPDARSLKGVEDDYDMIVCGSDQIWNTRCSDADDAYYLSFVSHTPTVAYAASMGANNILGKGEAVETHYRELVNRIDAVSVREINAKKWLEELTGRKIEITADPTLLLDRAEWLKLCLDRVVKEKYIFYYSFGYDPYYTAIVERLSKQTGLPVIVLDAKNWVKQKLFLKGIRLSKHSGPDVFLTLIKDAEIVVTSSLHGTIFSTIFQKCFWYLKPVNYDKQSANADDRAVSLLAQLGLMDRFVSEEELFADDVYRMPNYEESRQRREKLRETSFRFMEEYIVKGV
ncbi:MAG: polysaccharide pyruvyl transferase family protein [Acetatifactor sp.]|nr:polysaccharide pyruvyl transferase family protein [Acetatifactor sp.]